jgi:benzoyl-CoA-dihydrodiol lyase
MSETPAFCSERSAVDFSADPKTYVHWRMEFDGAVATLVLDVREDGGIRPGYKLKLNSYDLGVDIELNDALNRIRFEHPEVRAVVVASGKARMFSSGANIYMLGQASHAWKVNFCKFTNETRNGIEDSSRTSGLKFLAALNGTAAGGGYELALACDEILLVDDRSSTVSLPEVPLLGVLPGTGGLTRLIDKRRVRRDLADVFCTTAEGVRADRAKAWGLIDHAARPQQFADLVAARARALAALSDRPQGVKGVALTPLDRRIDDGGYRYPAVDVAIDRRTRTATLTVRAPTLAPPGDVDGILAEGAAWWPLAIARALDDAVLRLRANEPEIGTWLLKTRGDAVHVRAADAALHAHRGHWFVRETVGFLRRTLGRLDVSSRSLIALIEPGSCFVGTLFELALAADRTYMRSSGDEAAAAIELTAMNFGPYAMANGLTRIETRFAGRADAVDRIRSRQGQTLDAATALDLGLVTFAPDELDWDDEIRVAIEERASLSPDALTGMEASLRFAGPETLATRIFGRLSAWQNWIFNRPNAVGEKGALKVYGTGAKASFDWRRV